MTHKLRTHVSFDFAIKFLFRRKKYHHILEGFLTSLIQEPVKIVRVLESETNQQSPVLKLARVDIVVETSAGEIIILEHQYDPEKDFLQRVVFGVSRFLVDHMSNGEQYAKLQKIISANILYFKLFPQMTDSVYELKAELVGRHDKSVIPVSVTSGQELPLNQTVVPALYFVIVGRTPKEQAAKPKLNYIEQWIYFLNTSSILPSFDAPGIVAAAKLLSIIKLSLKDQRMWTQLEMDLMRQQGIIDTAIEAERRKTETERRNTEAERRKVEAERSKVETERNRVATIVTILLEEGRTVEYVMQLTGLEKDVIEKYRTQ